MSSLYDIMPRDKQVTMIVNEEKKNLFLQDMKSCKEFRDSQKNFNRIDNGETNQIS